LQSTYIHILAQRRDRYDVAGNIHVFRVKESNEIDNMDVGNGSHIYFQDGRHLFQMTYVHILAQRRDRNMILIAVPMFADVKAQMPLII